MRFFDVMSFKEIPQQYSQPSAFILQESWERWPWVMLNLETFR